MIVLLDNGTPLNLPDKIDFPGISHNSVVAQMKRNGIWTLLDDMYHPSEGKFALESEVSELDSRPAAVFRASECKDGSYVPLSQALPDFFIATDQDSVSLESEIVRTVDYLCYLASRLDQDLIGQREFSVTPVRYSEVKPNPMGYVADVEFEIRVVPGEYVSPVELSDHLRKPCKSYGRFMKHVCDVAFASLYERRLIAERKVRYLQRPNPAFDELDLVHKIGLMWGAAINMLHRKKHDHQWDAIPALNFKHPNMIIKDPYNRIFLDFSIIRNFVTPSAEAYHLSKDPIKSESSSKTFKIRWLDVLPAEYGKF